MFWGQLFLGFLLKKESTEKQNWLGVFAAEGAARREKDVCVLHWVWKAVLASAIINSKLSWSDAIGSYWH